MCTAVGQVSVFRVSTIPRTGFIARLAIPVLKLFEVISNIAVPVVSEPVPAVVGTIREISPGLGEESGRPDLQSMVEVSQ